MVSDSEVLDGIAKAFQNHPRLSFFYRAEKYLVWPMFQTKVCVVVTTANGGVLAKDWLILIAVNPQKHSLTLIEKSLLRVFDTPSLTNENIEL
jgi:hypothetical protein